MKKYHLFTHITYYPLGGIEDYVESFASLEETLVALKGQDEYSYDDWSIAETQEDGSLKEIANNRTHTIEDL